MLRNYRDLEQFPPTKLDMKHTIIIIILSLTIFTATADAHRLQPAYLEINEQTAGKFSILWKRPFIGSRPMNIYPQLPSGCSSLTEPVMQVSQSAAIERWLVDCGENGMANKPITIDGLSSTQTDVLVRIYYLEGTEETHLLRPASASVIMGGAPSATERIIAYLQLGIQHILMGVDHLLFVLGLLLIVQSRCAASSLKCRHRPFHIVSRPRNCTFMAGGHQSDHTASLGSCFCVWASSRFRLCHGVSQHGVASDRDPPGPVAV